MEDEAKIKEILEFWFGRVPGKRYGIREFINSLSRLPYWYGNTFSFLGVDEQLASRYEGLIQAAQDGKLDGWKSSLHGRLALILLLDQLPRNIYRNSAHAYDGDDQAFELAQLAIELGDDQAVNALARAFYYLPLMHQENIDVQNRSVYLHCKNVTRSNVLNILNSFGSYLFALRHQFIIKQFGRYPHRNQALGRADTAEELRFLRKPFSSF